MVVEFVIHDLADELPGGNWLLRLLGMGAKNALGRCHKQHN